MNRTKKKMRKGSQNTLERVKRMWKSARKTLKSS